MKILKILAACFAVLVLSAFFVFELIFSRSVDNSLSAYAEENITSDSVEPLSGDDPDPSIIDYHWDLSGFDQYNLNLFSYSFNNTLYGITAVTNNDGSITFNGTATSSGWFYVGSQYLVGSFTIKFYGASGLFNVTISYVGTFNDNSLREFNYSSNTLFGIQFNFTQGQVFNNYTLRPMLVKGTYTAETMPAYQPNLKYIFTTGFTNGYRDGYDTGYDSGRNYGYNLGYISGYDTGYSYGRNSQISEGLFKNPLDVFLQPISNFLNTDIFGSFSIGDGFTIAFFVMIALIFIKMFAGG